MPRIPFVEREDPDPTVRELLDWVAQVEGAVPNHFLVELHFPEHFKAWLNWVRTLWGKGELSFREVQHVGIAVSKANRCAYCTGSFCAVLEHGGHEPRSMVEEYLQKGIGVLGERERVLVEFAVKANQDSQGVTQADIDRLRQAGLGNRRIVQLVWLVNMFASSNHLTTVLAVDLDRTNHYQPLAASILAAASNSPQEGRT